MVRDLKGVGGRLILLNPIDDISKSIQSHVTETILIASTDVELITVLKQIDDEFSFNIANSGKFIKNINGKTIIRINSNDTNTSV